MRAAARNAELMADSKQDIAALRQGIPCEREN